MKKQIDLSKNILKTEDDTGKYILGNFDQETLNKYILLFIEINQKYNIFFDENKRLDDALIKPNFMNISAFDMDLLQDNANRLYPTFVHVNTVRSFDFYNYINGKIPNIDEYITTIMRGGYTYLDDKLSGMKITWLNKIDDRDNVISLSAFNGAYEGNQSLNVMDTVSSTSFGVGSSQYGGAIELNPRYVKKNIVVYLNTLIDALKDFKVQLNPNLWKIRIYIDKTLTSDKARKNETVSKFLNYVLDPNNKNFIELFEVEMDNFKIKNRDSHIGLLGVMFRFHALMDPSIKNCFVGEIDNYPTNILYDIINKFFNSEPEFKLMAFRPLIYNRKNEKNKCIPNFFAGMFGFRKQQNEILNPYLWANTFIYMNRLYKGYKDKTIQLPQCIPLKDNPKAQNPFEFGFEEQAISNVIIANYLMDNKNKLYVVPLFWLAPIKFTDYYLNNILLKKFNLLTNEFKHYFLRILKFDINIFIEELLVYHSFDNNLHIMTILECFLYNYLVQNNNKLELLTDDIKKDFMDPNKYKTINENGRLYINIFENISSMEQYKRLSGNLLLYTVYPGFELSINIESINELLNNLRSGKKLDFEQYITFNKSHSFNLQLYQVVTNYCPKFDLFKPVKIEATAPSVKGVQQPLVYTPDDKLVSLTGGSQGGSSQIDTYNRKYIKYKQKYLQLKKRNRQE